MTVNPHDDPQDHPPHEVQLCHLTITAAEMLAAEMDTAFQELIRRGALTPLSPRFEAAEAANRTVVLCRTLVEEIKRYERTRWGDVQDDIPF